MNKKKRPPRRELSVEEKCFHYDTLCPRDQRRIFYRYHSILEVPSYVRARITNQPLILSWLFRSRKDAQVESLRYEFMDRITHPVYAFEWMLLFPQDMDIMLERILRFGLSFETRLTQLLDILTKRMAGNNLEDLLDRMIYCDTTIELWLRFSESDFPIFANRFPELLNRKPEWYKLPDWMW